MADRVVLLLDGGFVTKVLRARHRVFPVDKDVIELTNEILAHDALAGMDLLRIHFYDADPFEGTRQHPIDGTIIDFRETSRARENRALLSGLERQPRVAVRRGSLTMAGWRLGSRASGNLNLKARLNTALEARDVVPDIRQKGVDLKIGLDIAWISLKRLADCIVLVTGDSDFAPAMKFARREGLKVYLDPLDYKYLRRELLVHADLVL